MVVGFSLLWIVSGISFLEPVFGWLIESPARLQNRVVESVAGVSGAAVEWAMPLWAVFASYGAMIIFTAWLAGRPGKSGPEPLVLPR
jgi:hypothetical protein